MANPLQQGQVFNGEEDEH